MKPLLSESEDNDALRTLGRASVQMVRDLKNQLNGFKLYDTFLRKRLKKGAAEELETIDTRIIEAHGKAKSRKGAFACTCRWIRD